VCLLQTVSVSFPATRKRHEEPATTDRVLSRDSRTSLAALARFETQNTLEFQQGESLTNMRRISQEWHEAYLEAAAIYSSERWRGDVPLLRDSISPLFSRLWVDLNVLRGELESASVADMTSVTGIANQLSGPCG